MESLQDQVALVRKESERLEHYLNTLPPDALSLPSACSRWEVGETWWPTSFGVLKGRRNPRCR